MDYLEELKSILKEDAKNEYILNYDLNRFIEKIAVKEYNYGYDAGYEDAKERYGRIE